MGKKRGLKCKLLKEMRSRHLIQKLGSEYRYVNAHFYKWEDHYRDSTLWTDDKDKILDHRRKKILEDARSYKKYLIESP